jgi:hypothetical protein
MREREGSGGFALRGPWSASGEACAIASAVLLAMAASACSRGEPAGRAPVASFAVAVAGEGAQYVYDAGGNILQIVAPSSPALAIVDFSPRIAGPGDVVTVFGSGFDPIASSDAVQLNGADVVVLSATPSELTFIIPASATSGKISVTTHGATATSATELAIVNQLTISDFEPRLGRPGTELVVTGFNFDVHPDGNAVAVGAGQAVVSAASVSSLLAVVGPTATSGKVTLTTALGQAVSTDDFFLLPDGYSEWDVAFAAREAPTGITTVTVGQTGKVGLVLFDGAQGESVTVFITASTFPSVSFAIYLPDGTRWFQSGQSGYSEFKVELPPPPATGTYSIVIHPEAEGRGSLGLRVLREVNVSLQQGFSTAFLLDAAQSARVTFSGNAGDSLSLACTALTTVPAGSVMSFYMWRPDGVYFWGGQASVGGWQLPSLPVSGTYTLLIRPSGPTATSMTLLLSRPNTGTVIVDGPAVQFLNSAPGQAGRFMFLGEPRDLLGMGVTAFATTPARYGVNVRIFKPDGTLLGSVAGPYGTGSWQAPRLPVSGAYTLSFEPSGAVTAAVTFLLSRPVTGALSPDSSSVTYQTARAGQSGRYTFDGMIGQCLTLQATSGATWPNGVAIAVYQPSGAVVASATLSSNRDTKLDLGALPVAGTYTVALVPQATDVGQVELHLASGATDTLAVDAPPKTLKLATAQNGRYTFAGVAGDWLGLAATPLVTTPANAVVTFTVYKPDGAVLSTASPSAETSWQLPQLPSTGTYTIRVAPGGTASASFGLMLSRALAGTIATDGTTMRHQTSRPGQAGRYVFAGTAGQRFTMQATGGPNLQYPYSISVYQPSGASVTAVQIGSGADSKVDLGALPATGSYTVVVVPTGATTGYVDLRLVAGASDTLAVGDDGKATVLTAAQNARYTFAANAGDWLGLALTAVSTSPASGTVNLAVYKPDGAYLWSGSGYAPTSFQLPQLGASGTYTLAVQPPGTASASLTLLLSQSLAGTLATDGTVTRHQTARPGQAGRYTFTGAAGVGERGT